MADNNDLKDVLASYKKAVKGLTIAVDQSQESDKYAADSSKARIARQIATMEGATGAVYNLAEAGYLRVDLLADPEFAQQLLKDLKNLNVLGEKAEAAFKLSDKSLTEFDYALEDALDTLIPVRGAVVELNEAAELLGDVVEKNKAEMTEATSLAYKGLQGQVAKLLDNFDDMPLDALNSQGFTDRVSDELLELRKLVVKVNDEIDLDRNVYNEIQAAMASAQEKLGTQPSTETGEDANFDGGKNEHTHER